MKKLRKRRLEEGDDLGLPWERWADGRPWRLKRKRHFGDVHPRIAREAAVNAAERMGKVVRVIRDRTDPDVFTWVQFSDHEIRLGDPCPCGSRRMLRLHRYFARCAECHAQLMLSPTSVEEEDEESVDLDDDAQLSPADILRELDDVHLARLEEAGDRRIYRGYARRAGTPVLVVVELPAEPNEQLKAERAFERAVAVQVVPFQQLSGMIDLSSVIDRGDWEWDLVLEGLHHAGAPVSSATS